MAGRCQLCDGRIVNGKCTDCGMDYSRMKSRYHLNENCDDYDLNARQINDNYEKTLLESDEIHRGRKKEKEKTTLNGKSSVKPNQRRKPTKEEVSARREARKEEKIGESVSYSYSAKPEEKKAKKKKKSGGLLGWIIVLCVIFRFASQILGDFNDNFGDIFDDDTDYSSYTEYSQNSEGYSDAEDNNEIHTYTITHGCYVIGVDLPSGDYEISNMDSENSVRIYIDQDDQEYDNFAVDAGSVYDEQLELYDGQILRIPDLANLKLVCYNAQMDDIQDPVNYDEEGTEKSYNLNGNAIVTEEVSAEGEELEPGRYSVRFKGEGTSTVGISVDDFTNTYFMLSSAENQPGADRYYGLELTEGVTVQMTQYGEDTDVEITFIPIDYYNYAEERFDSEGTVEEEIVESITESSEDGISNVDSVVESDSSL